MLITADDKKGNFLKCISMGIDHYLIKPFDISELIEAIETGFPFIQNQLSESEKGGIRTDLKILVIEDNVMNQKVIGTMINTGVFNFLWAGDGFKVCKMPGNGSSMPLILAVPGQFSISQDSVTVPPKSLPMTRLLNLYLEA